MDALRGPLQLHLLLPPVLFEVFTKTLHGLVLQLIVLVRTVMECLQSKVDLVQLAERLARRHVRVFECTEDGAEQLIVVQVQGAEGPGQRAVVLRGQDRLLRQVVSNDLTQVLVADLARGQVAHARDEALGIDFLHVHFQALHQRLEERGGVVASLVKRADEGHQLAWAEAVAPCHTSAGKRGKESDAANAHRRERRADAREVARRDVHEAQQHLVGHRVEEVPQLLAQARLRVVAAATACHERPLCASGGQLRQVCAPEPGDVPHQRCRQLVQERACSQSLHFTEPCDEVGNLHRVQLRQQRHDILLYRPPLVRGDTARRLDPLLEVSQELGRALYNGGGSWRVRGAGHTLGGLARQACGAPARTCTTRALPGSVVLRHLEDAQHRGCILRCPGRLRLRLWQLK
mmetsp:Transcript_61034/g.157387  ORF Transcript_61034/g.157387 Transcript_61034/m.157387 type:complete len:405 (+) Transcript_61034:525-1739(+)